MNAEFIEALNQLEKEKDISKDVIVQAIEAALISAYKRNFSSTSNARVQVDKVTGEIKVFARKNIVENPLDERIEISLDEARGISREYELGDIVELEVTPSNFGRIAAQTAKQVVTQRIREAERSMIFADFSGREGDIITGVVRRSDYRNYYLDLGKTEAILPFSDALPRERFRQGERLKTYVTNVENSPKGPKIFVSRTHPGFLKKLFELEVPEIQDGIVEIKSVTREAGYRSKIAVASQNPDIDPVGACVGYRGSRVQIIVDELQGEKIDVVLWSDIMEEFIANSLSPTKVSEVNIDADFKIARVIVPDNQLSLAIGKEGQNARLAAKLTNWKIDIKSETDSEEMHVY